MAPILCEWGMAGVETLHAHVAVLVIVDVLSFSTAVDVAASRGAIVYPFPFSEAQEAVGGVPARECWPDGSLRPARREFPVAPNYPIRRESRISPYLVRFQSERAAGGRAPICLRVPSPARGGGPIFAGVLLKSAGGRRRLFVVFCPSGRRPC
jgi:hypothetical protein